MGVAHRRLHVVDEDRFRQRPQRLGDHLLGRAKKHQPLDSFSDAFSQHPIIAALVDPSGKKNDRYRKTRQRFDNRADISPLVVVVVTHTVFLSDELETILETRKFFQSLLDDLRRYADGFRRGNGRHHIFHIVHALNFHMAQRESFFAGTVTPNNFLRFRKNAFVDFGEAEGDNSCAPSLPQAPYEWIVAIENRDILCCLVFEDPLLGTAIGGKVRITVEMVFRQIQQHRQPRTELLNPLQLEVAYFYNSHFPYT